MTDCLAWDPVHTYVRRILRGRYGPLPTAGSPNWQALSDDDPAKTAALLVAGDRWVLEEVLHDEAARQAALKEAAVEASQALDWARVAKVIADRDAYYKQHPDLRRKTA
ncbi:DUF2742 domain-containing protein [Gordonia sp. (in: high G+C Gram-positive bacteria)]|uniref:DUF2742 domain-containing protein n=1 Tax=Gordonia sp. (in: high G+C Gram-positive bacteria) TaxID=84139 RepID=UPI0033418818